jgi:hypothetical protein
MFLDNNKVLKLSNILLHLVFLGGVGIFLTLPFCLKMYLDFTNLYNINNYVNIMAVLYTTGVLALLIVHFIIKMFKNVSENKSFINENVKILNNIARCSIVISLIYLISIFIIKSFFVIILFMIFVIIGLMSFVIAGLFSKAISYKEENDLTI